MKYLGYVVGHGTLKTDPDKLSAITEYPPPISVRQVRRFLGMVGWYRRFFHDFATLATPLTELLKKGKTFEWTPEAQTAFENLKAKLLAAPVLASPDFKRPFVIQFDVSHFGIGGLLAELNDDGVEVPIAYLSQKVNKAQRDRVGMLRSRRRT